MLKGLKNVFFEEIEEEIKETKPVAKTAPVKPQTPTAPAFITRTTSNTSSGTGKIKDLLVDQLNAQLLNSPYLQFQKMNSTMRVKVADSTTRLAAIAASMEVQGFTKEKILEGARNAIAFLEQEAHTFANDIASSIQQTEQDYTNKVGQIDQLLVQKQDAIKTLSDEILNLQKEKSSLGIENQQQKSKLEVDKIEFNSSMTALQQEINNDITDLSRC